MTNHPSSNHRWGVHNWIAVLVNALVGGVVGAAFGLFGSFIPWLVGGLLVGALLGLANEALFVRTRRLARWYKLRTVILVLGEALLVFYVVVPAMGVYDATHPGRVAVVGAPADLGLPYEDVFLSAADGVTLRGWYIPSQNSAAIIALHGAGGNRNQLLRHAHALTQAGYGVLLFDLRAHGESEGTLFPMTDDSQDVAPAVAFLQGRAEVDPERIGAVGLSLGGEVILEAAAGDPALKALVVDGVSTNRIEDLLPLPPEYRIMYLAAPMWWVGDRMAALVSGVPARPLVELVEQIAPRPILFISSRDAPEPFMNRRLAERAGLSAQLWELPDTGHVGGIFAHPEEYKERMISFFDAALLD
jgi:pimeloyl-ACP methyl ester carboxylesterase